MYINFIESTSEPIGKIIEDQVNSYSLYIGKGKNLRNYFIAIRNFMNLYIEGGEPIYVSVKTKPAVIKMLMQYNIELVLI